MSRILSTIYLERGWVMTVKFGSNLGGNLIPSADEIASISQGNDPASFRRVDDWEETRFNGGENFQGPPFDPDLKCTFFPRQAASTIESRIAQAVSNMILMEIVIERFFLRKSVSDLMAEIRCELLEQMFNLITPEDDDDDDPCVMFETVPGFKWVPKEEGEGEEDQS